MKGFKTFAIALLGLSFAAQGYANNAPPYVYSVKYICGLQKLGSTNPPQEPPVKPGNYATSINIHNYHMNTGAVILRKAVVANGVSGTLSNMELKPNQAIYIDCPRIIRMIPSGVPAFIEGFVEIISNVQLSVAAVYTSQGCRTGAAGIDCVNLGDVSLQVVPQPYYSEP